MLEVETGWLWKHPLPAIGGTRPERSIGQGVRCVHGDGDASTARWVRLLQGEGLGGKTRQLYTVGGFTPTRSDRWVMKLIKLSSVVSGLKLPK